MRKDKKIVKDEKVKGKKSLKLKSIRTKIMLCMSLTVLIAMLIVGTVSSVTNYRSTMDTIEQSMTEMAKIASARVEKELAIYRSIATEVGCSTLLADPEVSVAEKQQYINDRVATYQLQRGNVLDRNGKSIFNGTDYSDRGYFQSSMKGAAAVSEPLISRTTNELSIIISAPLWKDGKINSEVVGVVYFVPNENLLNDIMATVNISKDGGAFILNGSGETIAHKNKDNVLNGENVIEAAKTDKSKQHLAELEQKMINGEHGFAAYEYYGTPNIMSYCPIENTDHWSLGVYAPKMDFTASTMRSIIVTVILSILAVIAAIILAWKISGRIGKPIADSAQALEQLSQGNLASEIPSTNAQDETGILLRATNILQSELSTVIGDVKHILNHMAQGDFSVKSKNKDCYVGEFSDILSSMKVLKREMVSILKEIDRSADQVSGGSENVSGSSQALAQGATEQASAVEELAATINDISNQIQETANHSQVAKNETMQSHDAIEICSQHMQSLVDAIDTINAKSSEVSKVIKTIEDIAFQTNILALNAAVEAARAGAAGKGFSVVADEVRNLANKSGEAAQNTTVLIEDTLKAVAESASSSHETDTALKQVVISAQAVLDAVIKIADAANEQSQSITQISQGIDQISSVVQTNSATAEQSAAASQELSAQANVLKKMVERFKLP